MRLRLLFFLTLSGIAVLPLIALASWNFIDALDREIESVNDKHLVIAKNIGEAFDRYSADLRHGFEHVANLPPSAQKAPAVSAFMHSMNLNQFSVADLSSENVHTVIHADGPPRPKTISPDLFRTFVGLLENDKVVFSPIMLSLSGEPIVYMPRAYGDRLVIDGLYREAWQDGVVRQERLRGDRRSGRQHNGAPASGWAQSG